MDTAVRIRPAIEIEPALHQELLTQADEQGQIIIHFRYLSATGISGDKIRIWPSTYIESLDDEQKTQLAHAEHIALMPEWTVVRSGAHDFTLIFPGLASSVTAFRMIEYCDSAGAPFQIPRIERCESDVYFVMFS